MHPKMVDFLDGIGFGTGLLIVGALISILILGYKYFKGFRKTIDDQAEERIAARETTKKIQASIEETNNTLKELTLKISNVENKVTDLDTKYSNTIRDITTDMCNMTNRLETNIQESNNADAVLEAKLNEYNLNIEKVGNNLSDLTAKTNRLIESDRESIKAYIAGIHKTATTDGYIDFHILSIVEHQYETYLRENGNTFVAKLMEEIHTLPNSKEEMSDDDYDDDDDEPVVPVKKTTRKKPSSTTKKATTRKKK